MRRPLDAAVLLVVPSLLVACGGPTPQPPAAKAAPTITNRIPLPPDVVANLGISFAKARRGRLETRLRVPGRLEVAPDARFTLRAPAAGRVAVGSRRWQRVEKGAGVAELVSPALRTAQEALADAEAEAARVAIEIERTRAEVAPLAGVADAASVALAAASDRARDAELALAAAQALEREALARVEATQKLAADSGLTAAAVYAARKDHAEAQSSALEAARRRDESRTAVADLTLRLATARAKASTVEREVAALERRLATLGTSARQQLRALAVLTGSSFEALSAAGPFGPAWTTLEVVPIRAPADGLVAEVVVTDGEWVESGAPLVRLVDPARKVFRGEVPESDLARIPPDATVRVEVGCADCAPIDARLETAFQLADPRTRTVALEARVPGDASAYPDGSSAVASVLLGAATAEETLVPAACVVQDELELIVFRRDPANPDQVVRTPVAVGRAADGWVEVLAEVGVGDELVRDGVHQLRLTGIGKAPANGHFHADGSWHEGKD